jgi:hypothetical protein
MTDSPTRGLSTAGEPALEHAHAPTPEEQHGAAEHPSLRPEQRARGVRTVIRSPGRPKILRISAGSRPVLPNQCGTWVSNSATSPGPRTQSRSPRNKPHPAGQHVDPLMAVVGSWLRSHLPDRDDDLPSLHTVWLTSQRDNGPALDPAGLEPDAGVTYLGCIDEGVERHPVGLREREQQLQGRPPLPVLEARQRALGDPGRLRDTDQRHSSLCADLFQPRTDLVHGLGGGCDRRSG